MRYTMVLVFAMVMATACGADGKVWLKTDPAGAEIFTTETDENGLLTDLNKKTSGLVEVPQGTIKFVFKLDGYKSTVRSVEVNGMAIIKPDVISLERQTVSVDLIFDEGWGIQVDKQVVMDKHMKPSSTPCTIDLSLGVHNLTLSKIGFEDITKKIDVKSSQSLEITEKIKPSLKPKVVQSSSATILGKFVIMADDKSIIYINGQKVAEVALNASKTSFEVSIREGDIIVADLINYEGGYYYTLYFESKDGLRMIPKTQDYKDVTGIDIDKITSSLIEESKETAQEVTPNPELLTLWKKTTSVSSQWVWGKNSKESRLALIVKKSMFTQKGK